MKTDNKDIFKIFEQICFKTVILYSLLLIPTIFIFGKAIVMQIPVSKLVAQVIWAKSNHHSLLFDIINRSSIILIIAGITYLYYQGYKLFKGYNKEVGKNFIFKLFLYSGIIGIILIWLIPFFSTDFYGYINRGAEQAFYNANPYITPLGKLAGWHNDLMFHEHWMNNPAPYGFHFVYIAKWVCLLSSHHFFIAFLLLKSLNLLLYLLTGLCVYKFSRYLGIARPWFGTYLYLMNPLMLLQLVGEGHNDIFLSFLLILVLMALSSDKYNWATIPVLILSFLTKYASILAFPLILIYLYKRTNRKNIILGSLMAICIFGFFANIYLTAYIPIKNIFGNAVISDKSLHALLYAILKDISKVFPVLKSFIGLIEQWFKVSLWAGFALFFAWLISYFSKNISIHYQDKVNSIKFLIHNILLVMLLLIMLVSSKFHPWYLGMFFPLAFLLEEKSPLRQYVLLISIIQLLIYTPLERSSILNYGIMVILPSILFIKHYKKQINVNNIKDALKNILQDNCLILKIKR